MCSLRFDVAVSEPVKVLKIDECSTRTEDKPNEPDRPLAKPLISEPARESEPVSVLVSEKCSVIVEDEPKEPVKNSTRPLNTVVTKPSESLRDLPMPLV